MEKYTGWNEQSIAKSEKKTDTIPFYSEQQMKRLKDFDVCIVTLNWHEIIVWIWISYSMIPNKSR